MVRGRKFYIIFAGLDTARFYVRTAHATLIGRSGADLFKLHWALLYKSNAALLLECCGLAMSQRIFSR
jgi:hypothetical protein